MEIVKYAPVLIPTLNRYEHFRRCLESLERCTGANKTEVFVALDYPPSDKYKNGWERIDDYLKTKETNHQFKKLNVVRRNRNYGIGHENSNTSVLLRDVEELYDNFIFTEDDNEFSPNFLEYINWGLQSFSDNENVYAICGYNEIDMPQLRNNIYSYPRFCAWGYGSWFNRLPKVFRYRNTSVLLQHAKEISWRVIFNSEELLHAFHVLRMIHRNTFYGDSLRGCLPKEERICVFPKISKVKNHGRDGSGQHGKGTKMMINHASMLTLDNDKCFIPIVVDDIHQQKVDRQIQSFYKIGIKRHIVCSIAFLLWKCFRINIC